ncbi:AMP-binding protein [Aeromicrobium sp.]|uniref:AMP-binding protein n=1 Tax=Aeromicrobium sp. TaxID=1871063 RepID=UPI0030BC6CD6
MNPGRGVTVVTDTLHALSVLRQAGLVEPTRPLLMARSIIAPRRLGPIAGAVAMSARRSGSNVAVIDERGSLTYAELEARANALARAWTDLGVKPGDVVAALCRDHRGLIDVMVAAGKSGARLVLLNTGFAKPQLADVATREGVRLLVADEEFVDLLSAVGEDVITVIGWSDGGDPTRPTLDALIDAYDSAPVPAPPSQGGMVLLTGGTTGTPKGAPRQISNSLVAAQFLERVPQRRGDVVVVAAPIFHGTGLSQFIMALVLGSTTVLRRRFDPEAVIRDVADNRGTVLVVVPTMLQRILALGDETLSTLDTSSLRIIMTAGAALPPDLGDRVTEAFGPVVHNLYGCTEVALATVAMPEDWAIAPGTVGRAPRGISVKLFDDEDQEITSPGTSGRIFVNNGLTFEGYTGGGTKPVIGAHMGTGDTGHWDEHGLLFVDGRDDDMIVSGGENVFPAEIEALVEAMPGIEDVATMPVDDADFGTRLRLFVVAGDGAPSESEIKDHIRANLARFKVPRDVLFVDEIPHTAVGKVDRRGLSALAT